MLIAGLVAGCGAITGPERVAPPGPSGPELMIDVVNRSAREVTVGYTFEAAASAGAGEGLVPACSRSSMGFGAVGGRYEIHVDDEAVLDAVLPEGTPDEGFLVVRLVIEADGSADAAAPPGWTRIPPEPNDALIPGCG